MASGTNCQRMLNEIQSASDREIALDMQQRQKFGPQKWKVVPSLTANSDNI